MIRHSYVGGIVNNPNWQWPPKYQVTAYLNKEDTYLLIFTRDQTKQLECLEASDKVKILYKAPAAKNLSSGHQSSRNTLVIFEKA